MSSQYPSSVAFFQEVTQGLAPADAAAWVASGRRIRHIAEAMDPVGLQQQVVDDQRSQTRIMGKNLKVKGLRGVQQPWAVYATGSGATTAGGAQIAETDLMTQLEHAFGHLHRSNSTTVRAGGPYTTSVFDLTATTNISAGCLIAVSDVSTGALPVVVQVIDVTGNAVTVFPELPFTPVATDVVSAMATIAIDETILVDSNGGGGPYTFGWHIQKGLAAALENWQLHGCKLQVDSIQLGRGDLPRFDGTIFAASFLGPNEAPSPTWTGTPTGNAPVAIGPNTDVQLCVSGDDTRVPIHVGSCTVSFGVPVVPTETQTEVDDNMEGVASYCTAPADTIVSLGIVPMSDSFWDDFDGDEMKFFLWSKRAAAGQLFAICVPYAEIVAQPTRGTQNARSRANVELCAHPNPLGSTALASSKILIGIG